MVNSSLIKKRNFFVPLVILFFLFISCGGGGGGNDGGATGTSLNLTGDWSGYWSSYSEGGGTVSGTMIQNGTDISGTLIIPGSPCFKNAILSGHINGTTVTFTVTSGRSSVVYSAANATSISLNGEYVVQNTGTVCDGDAGVFNMTKK